jgi:ATP-dependent RNA helicase SUPV3L1/SUV3
LSDQARQELGWSEAEADRILKALGFTRARKAQPDAPPAWRPPWLEARPKPAARDTHSPFAALAALKPAPARKRRPPRRRARVS